MSAAERSATLDATARGATVRPALACDAAAVLALNQAEVRVLSPLDGDRLAWLRGLAAVDRVAEVAGEVVGFLLALREGTAYDSPNYRWFAERHAQFLYIDRVVVAASAQGRGIGRLLYADLFALARASGVAMVCCEFDIEPPNAASQRFHAGFGFAEVGTQALPQAAKRVSLQAVVLGR